MFTVKLESINIKNGPRNNVNNDWLKIFISTIIILFYNGQNMLIRNLN